jgi:hypothetical protein
MASQDSRLGRSEIDSPIATNDRRFARILPLPPRELAVMLFETFTIGLERPSKKLQRPLHTTMTGSN